MPQTAWIVSALAAHGVFASVALVLAVRSGCTRAQFVAQAGLALFVPALGAIVVLAMAKDALAAPPPPDDSRFDRNYTGEG